MQQLKKESVVGRIASPGFADPRSTGGDSRRDRGYTPGDDPRPDHRRRGHFRRSDQWANPGSATQSVTALLRSLRSQRHQHRAKVETRQ